MVVVKQANPEEFRAPRLGYEAQKLHEDAAQVHWVLDLRPVGADYRRGASGLYPIDLAYPTMARSKRKLASLT